jgi:hypothetical protein
MFYRLASYSTDKRNGVLKMVISTPFNSLTILAIFLETNSGPTPHSSGGMSE